MPNLSRFLSKLIVSGSLEIEFSPRPKEQSEKGISPISVRSAEAYHSRRDRAKQSSFVARQILTFNYFIFFYNRYEISDIRNSRKKEKYRIFINLLLLA